MGILSHPVSHQMGEKHRKILMAQGLLSGLAYRKFITWGENTWVNSQSKFHSAKQVEISEGNQRNSVWEKAERGKKSKAKTGNPDQRGYIERSPRESFPD